MASKSNWIWITGILGLGVLLFSSFKKDSATPAPAPAPAPAGGDPATEAGGFAIGQQNPDKVNHPNAVYDSKTGFWTDVAANMFYSNTFKVWKNIVTQPVNPPADQAPVKSTADVVTKSEPVTTNACGSNAVAIVDSVIGDRCAAAVKQTPVTKTCKPGTKDK